MYVEFATEPEHGITITWGLDYEFSPIVDATYLDTPEGGVEIDQEPTTIGVEYYNFECSRGIEITGIQAGSILCHLLVGKYGTPSDDECFDAANGDREDPRW